MFIDTRLLTFTAPEERNFSRAFSFAPTKLGLVCDCCSYKHSSPTELTRLVAALRRRESVCDHWVSFSLYLARHPIASSNELKSLRFRIAASPSLMRRATLGPS